MALFGQDQVDPRVAAGGAALGDLLLGGPGQRAEGAYVDQFGKQARAADLMWKAREQRAQAIAREGIGDSITAAGYDPKFAPLLGNVLTAADTPNLRNLGEFADPADIVLDQQRREAMEAGDVPRYNRLTAVRKDKAYQPARVAGGHVLPDGGGLGDAAVPLPATQARIDQGQERTAAAVARSNRGPAPRAPKPSPTARRAATLDEDIAIIEGEIGRALTPQERAAFLQGKTLKFDDLGNAVAVEAPAQGLQSAPRAEDAGRRTRDIPAGAIRALWDDPSLEPQFAEKYGRAAAREALARKPR